MSFCKMENKKHIRVMLVEEDEEVLEKYRELISAREMLQLAAETADPKEALRILERTSVDALILELEMQKGSGILLLNRLNKLSVEKPFIVVVTNVVSKSIYSAIRSMGVDYICVKDDLENAVSVSLAIVEICAPYRKTKERAGLIAGELNVETREDICKRIIEYELESFGFSQKMSGTQYIREALLYLMMAGNPEISMTKEMYPYIALKFKTNPNSVERNIRIAIEKVWTDREIKVLKERYPYEWNAKTGRPTNAEFLYNIANSLNIMAFDVTIK